MTRFFRLFRRLNGPGWGAGGMALWTAPALLLSMTMLLPPGGAALAILCYNFGT